MSLILLLIIICIIIEIYLISLIIIVFIYKMYYYKDGNKKGTNLKGRILKKAIKHELIHVCICNIFKFTDWKIISKIDGLACKMDIYYDTLNWKSLFNFFKMCIFHFIFDIWTCIIWIDIISICEYIQKYFLDVRRIIGKFIDNKKIN